MKEEVMNALKYFHGGGYIENLHGDEKRRKILYRNSNELRC